MRVGALERDKAACWRSSRLVMSNRDHRIIERAIAKLAGSQLDFAEALRALREAVEEEIPDGRVFILGCTEHGPIVGSIISGVGIAEGPAGVTLVRARPGDVPSFIASLHP